MTFIKGKSPAPHKENCSCFRCSGTAWNKGLKRWWSSNKFKKGSIPWNKGIHPEYVQEANNPAWKGDNVGYVALHAWVKRNLGKAVWCEWCASCIKVEWANVSRQYKRDWMDWMQLCVKCHNKYDSGQNRGAAKNIFEKSEDGNHYTKRRIAV